MSDHQKIRRPAIFPNPVGLVANLAKPLCRGAPLAGGGILDRHPFTLTEALEQLPGRVLPSGGFLVYPLDQAADHRGTTSVSRHRRHHGGGVDANVKYVEVRVECAGHSQGRCEDGIVGLVSGRRYENCLDHRVSPAGRDENSIELPPIRFDPGPFYGTRRRATATATGNAARCVRGPSASGFSSMRTLISCGK